MTLLDRYLIKILTKNYILLLGGFVGIFFLIDFFERIDNFLEKNLPVSLAIKYFILKTPFMVEQLTPITIMLGGVVTLGLLNTSRELLALQSTGIPINRVVRPIIGGALFFSFVNLALVQWLLPVTITQTNKIWYQDVNNQYTEVTVRAGRVYFRGREGFYSFDMAGGGQQQFQNFSYTAIDDEYGFKFQVSAAQAEWNKGQWLFQDGQIKQFDPAGEVMIELFSERGFSLPERSDELFVPKHQAEEVSLSRLFSQALSADDPYSSKAAWRRLNSKISYILLGLPLLLVGLPALLFCHSRWNLDLSLAVPASCCIAYFCWLFWGTLQSLVKAGYMAPTLAAWPLHLIVGALGIYWLRRLSAG